MGKILGEFRSQKGNGFDVPGGPNGSGNTQMSSPVFGSPMLKYTKYLPSAEKLVGKLLRLSA